MKAPLVGIRMGVSDDGGESDAFILSGAVDLPCLRAWSGAFARSVTSTGALPRGTTSAVCMEGTYRRASLLPSTAGACSLAPGCVEEAGGARPFMTDDGFEQIKARLLWEYMGPAITVAPYGGRCNWRVRSAATLELGKTCAQ